METVESNPELHEENFVSNGISGNQLIHKIISESYPLAQKSVCLLSYHFIHQNKPDHVGYQEAKGFYDPSTYCGEKGCITCLGNFWTPCRLNLASLARLGIS